MRRESLDGFGKTPGISWRTSGTTRSENAEVCLEEGEFEECERRHCEERKRRSNPFFLRTAKLDCFAEPAIGRAFARPVGSQ